MPFFEYCAVELPAIISSSLLDFLNSDAMACKMGERGKVDLGRGAVR